MNTINHFRQFHIRAGLHRKTKKNGETENLYLFYSFYRERPDIFHTVSGNSQILLSWSHYRVLLQVNDPEARTWYEQEAAAETWSVRTLQRNISTQYYYRLLSSRDKEPVITEMNQKTALLQEKASFIKNPYILEFLGLPEDPATTESKLENSIITNLQRFLMEFGKGFAFVARQQHIHTEKEDYYIDLVLIILNTFQLSYPRFNYLKWAQEGGLGFMTGTSAAVQSICQRTAYRPYREAGRKAEYGRFSVLPRPEIYRNLCIKDSVKIEIPLPKLIQNRAA